MKKRIIVAILLAVGLTPTASTLLRSAPAMAAFNSNSLVDDFTFDSTNTMSSTQIDTWLNNNFGATSCISTAHGFSAPDPTGYTPSNGFTYGGNVSGGQVISDAARGYGINPQVLLTTLQKEQSLVSGNAGCSVLRYTGAMGYGCPDSGTTHNYPAEGALVAPLYYINGSPVSSVSGTCVNTAAKAGFSQQIIHAAWLLKFGEQRSEGKTSWNVQATNYPANGDVWDNSDDPQTCYSGPMTQGSFKRCSTDANPVFYDGYTTIDSSSTHMDNGATAALYWYTPHFSGNQNFDTIFNQWFGSQYANDTYTAHPNGTLVSYGGRVYLIDGNTRRWITNGDVFDSYNYNWSQVKAATTGDTNLSSGANINTLAPGTIFRSDNTPVFVMTYESGTLVKQQISYAAYNTLGYNWSDVQYVSPGNVPAATSASILVAAQHPAGTLVADRTSGSGKVYLLDQSSKRWILGSYAVSTNGLAWSRLKTATSADLSLPDGSNLDLRQGAILSSGGNIYVVDYDVSGIMKRPLGPYECFANRLHYTANDAYSVPPSSLPARTAGLFTC